MSTLAELQTTLKLLSDPVRLRLLALLSQEELAVHELVTITGWAQSRVSNHLSLLRRSGLILDRREGSWSFYRLAEPAAGEPLTPELFAGAVRPYLDSEDGQRDAAALDAVREARRERSRSTHDALAERWVEVGQEFATGALRLEAWASLVPESLTVADLGCGAGYLTDFLARRGARVVAVDHSQNMLKAARDRLREFDVEFRRGDLEQIPIDDDEVDAAFANLVWHHLGDMDAAAAEVRRIVRPGGFVVITDLLPHDEDWMRDAMGDLRLGVRPETVAAALARVGFVDLETRGIRDSYRVEGPEGRAAALPMFLVRGRLPGADDDGTST